MSSTVRATAEYNASDGADWGGGMSSGCTAGPIVRWRGQR